MVHLLVSRLVKQTIVLPKIVTLFQKQKVSPSVATATPFNNVRINNTEVIIIRRSKHGIHNITFGLSATSKENNIVIITRQKHGIHNTFGNIKGDNIEVTTKLTNKENNQNK